MGKTFSRFTTSWVLCLKSLEKVIFKEATNKLNLFAKTRLRLYNSQVVPLKTESLRCSHFLVLVFSRNYKWLLPGISNSYQENRITIDPLVRAKFYIQKMLMFTLKNWQ